MRGPPRWDSSCVRIALKYGDLPSAGREAVFPLGELQRHPSSRETGRGSKGDVGVNGSLGRGVSRQADLGPGPPDRKHPLGAGDIPEQLVMGVELTDLTVRVR